MNPLPPADALVVIDIGNTRIGLGVCDGDGVHDVVRVPADEPQAWPEAIARVWSATSDARQRAIVIASVAPQQTARMAAMVEEQTGMTPLRIREDVPLPLPLEIDNPDEVGVDRVCNAAAAFERVGGACAVAAFGTAITIDCVSEEGHFIGGAILPGLEMSCAALHAHTAQLPEVHPADPQGPFARNTHDAIVNGVAYAAVGALREIVERFATSLGAWPQLIVTGGNATIVSNLADFVDAVVPDLGLMGIALAYRRAAGEAGFSAPPRAGDAHGG